MALKHSSLVAAPTSGILRLVAWIFRTCGLAIRGLLLADAMASRHRTLISQQGTE